MSSGKVATKRPRSGHGPRFSIPPPAIFRGSGQGVSREPGRNTCVRPDRHHGRLLGRRSVLLAEGPHAASQCVPGWDYVRAPNGAFPADLRD
jgi:hypothetical protein